MAVVTRPCGVFPCVSDCACRARTPRNGWTIKSSCDFIKTQLCTVAISLSFFNSVRLPREATKHGAIPYLVLYTFWLIVISLPTALLQLAMGQLSQQDPVGVWRAVPILKGVGHLKIITSYLCCVYNVLLLALSAAYLIWIAKGTFPLKDCTKLHITPHGYENKINASQCFNSTFLAPFTEYPQYLGVMAILIFVLWLFVPVFLFRLRKSLKVFLDIFGPIIIIFAIVLCTFLGNNDVMSSILASCEQWAALSYPNIWYSSLVQALMSTQIFGGYLISAGGSIYRHSDVRWTTTSIIAANLLAGWAWVLIWESIGGKGTKDTSFLSILVLIYQSSVTEKRDKAWPLLAYGMICLSGIVTVMTLLFPIYDKLHRVTGDHWRLFASATSAIGTALSVAVLAKGIEVATVMDEMILPVISIFTAAVEVVGFVFIYGWCNLNIDIEFLTGSKVPYIWTAGWWTTPLFLIFVIGWWLRSLLRAAWGQMQALWPLLGAFVVILVIMIVMAAIAVAKEEQFNLFTKITSAFRPSRLWGPEEPMARYVWMSQRYVNEILSNDNKSISPYPEIKSTKAEKQYQNGWNKNTEIIDNNFSIYANGHNLRDDFILNGKNPKQETNFNIGKNRQKKIIDEKFRSPNICIAKEELGDPVQCNCNRHFTLNVPIVQHNELTTSL